MFELRIDIVNNIKSLISIDDVIFKYGFQKNSKGFMCCPFHNEKTPSLKIYQGQSGWHCFGCGANGDVITFVQKLFNLSFQEALKKIDVDFGLNLYGDKTFEELRKSHYQTKQLQAKREREKAERERTNIEYWVAFDEWKRLDDNKQKYAPKMLGEKLHPLFVEALQKMAHQEYLLERAEERRMRA